MTLIIIGIVWGIIGITLLGFFGESHVKPWMEEYVDYVPVSSQIFRLSIFIFISGPIFWVWLFFLLLRDIGRRVWKACRRKT